MDGQVTQDGLGQSLGAVHAAKPFVSLSFWDQDKKSSGVLWGRIGIHNDVSPCFPGKEDWRPAIVGVGSIKIAVPVWKASFLIGSVPLIQAI